MDWNHAFFYHSFGIVVQDCLRNDCHIRSSRFTSSSFHTQTQTPQVEECDRKRLRSSLFDTYTCMQIATWALDDKDLLYKRTQGRKCHRKTRSNRVSEDAVSKRLFLKPKLAFEMKHGPIHSKRHPFIRFLATVRILCRRRHNFQSYDVTRKSWKTTNAKNKVLSFPCQMTQHFPPLLGINEIEALTGSDEFNWLRNGCLDITMRLEWRFISFHFQSTTHTPNRKFEWWCQFCVFKRPNFEITKQVSCGVTFEFWVTRSFLARVFQSCTTSPSYACRYNFAITLNARNIN